MKLKYQNWRLLNTTSSGGLHIFCSYISANTELIKYISSVALNYMNILCHLHFLQSCFRDTDHQILKCTLFNIIHVTTCVVQCICEPNLSLYFKNIMRMSGMGILQDQYSICTHPILLTRSMNVAFTT
jgi:hypothetical protein